ncbi:MAG: hypothetical protein V2A34_14690 [Lentisphaerota bacterium]
MIKSMKELALLLITLLTFQVALPCRANVAASVHLSLTLKQMGSAGDSDGDGIDDAWEIRLFGRLDIVTAASDFDLDGFTDAEEFVAGSNPKDPNSALELATIKVLPNGQLQIIWQSTTSTDPAPRLYDIFTATSMRDLQTNKIVLGQDIPSGGEVTTLNNVPTGGASYRFYGINVRINR